jgi:hypothetical protein
MTDYKKHIKTLQAMRVDAIAVDTKAIDAALDLMRERAAASKALTDYTELHRCVLCLLKTLDWDRLGPAQQEAITEIRAAIEASK